MEKTNKKTLEEIIRVDHAGEYGAKRIYQGQIDFIRNPETKAQIQEMLEHELEHLEYFENQIKEGQLRPTIFYPIWHVAGYALGAVTAMLGDKAAMACTYAVEDVIEGHYQKQIDQLEGVDEELREKLVKFRDDEVEHKNTAIDEGSREAFGYSVLRKTINETTKAAIFLAERI